MNNVCCLEILIVEDEVDICDMTEYIARDMGCTVYKAHTAQAGLDLLKKHKGIRLGIFDYHLSDGKSVSEWSSGLGRGRELNQDLQYFLITGDLAVTNEKARELGAIGVIPKPATGEELQTLIAHFIRINRSSICIAKDRLCPNN